MFSNGWMFTNRARTALVPPIVNMRNVPSGWRVTPTPWCHGGSTTSWKTKGVSGAVDTRWTISLFVSHACRPQPNVKADAYMWYLVSCVIADVKVGVNFGCTCKLEVKCQCVYLVPCVSIACV
jgi:hypothetical protein